MDVTTRDSQTSENRSEVKVIMVMGPTGAGKSTLTNSVSDGGLRVSNSLASCTQKCSFSSPFGLDGTLVQLIDTPGFNDSVRSDMEVLEEIVNGLDLMKSSGKALYGVIYLHNISESRMTGSARQNFRTFLELCGSAAMKNVAIVTGRWDCVSRDVGETREIELKSDDRLFQPAIRDGAQWFRNDRPPETVHEPIRYLIQLEPLRLGIQDELASCHSLLQTKAGSRINHEMTEQLVEHQARLQKLNEEFETARRQHDEEAQDEIDQERESTKRRLEYLQSVVAIGRLREQSQSRQGWELAPPSWMMKSGRFAERVGKAAVAGLSRAWDDLLLNVGSAGETSSSSVPEGSERDKRGRGSQVRTEESIIGGRVHNY